jgi:prepilin-type N-terminal cleavage/methylation domain-containing protein
MSCHANTGHRIRHPEATHASQYGFSLLELIIALTIIGIMLSLLFPAIHMVHEHSRRAACGENLHQLSLATAMYVDAQRSLWPAPLDGRPGGWTIAILPFIEEQSLADRFRVDQGLASPGNLDAAAHRPQLFVCPVTGPHDSFVKGIGATDYLMFVDPKDRLNWKRAHWSIKDAPADARYPWSAGPEMSIEDGGYPPPHSTPFGF